MKAPVAQPCRASAYPSPVRSNDTERGNHDDVLDTAPTGDEVVAAKARTATMVAYAMARPTRETSHDFAR